MRTEALGAVMRETAARKCAEGVKFGLLHPLLPCMGSKGNGPLMLL